MQPVWLCLFSSNSRGRWPWTEKSKQIFTDGQIHRWNIFKGKLAQVVWNLVNLTKQIIQQNVNWGRYIIFNSTGNGGTNEIYGNWNKMLQIKLLRQTLKSSKQFYSLLSTDLFSFPSLFVCWPISYCSFSILVLSLAWAALFTSTNWPDAALW